MDFLLFDTSLGQMGLAAEGEAITRLYLPNTPTPRLMSHSTPLLEAGRQQLLEYLSGERREFDLPLDLQGTDFQKKVWTALQNIPWGEIRSYRDIAQTVGCPRGFRTVGMANHSNPIPILIPCHRVVGSRGALTGYAGGVELKKALLTLEGILAAK